MSEPYPYPCGPCKRDFCENEVPAEGTVSGKCRHIKKLREWAKRNVPVNFDRAALATSGEE